MAGPASRSAPTTGFTFSQHRSPLARPRLASGPDRARRAPLRGAHGPHPGLRVHQPCVRPSGPTAPPDSTGCSRVPARRWPSRCCRSDVDGADVAILRSLRFDSRTGPRPSSASTNPTIPWDLQVEGPAGAPTGCSLSTLVAAAAEQGLPPRRGVGDQRAVRGVRRRGPPSPIWRRRFPPWSTAAATTYVVSDFPAGRATVVGPAALPLPARSTPARRCRRPARGAPAVDVGRRPSGASPTAPATRPRLIRGQAPSRRRAGPARPACAASDGPEPHGGEELG